MQIKSNKNHMLISLLNLGIAVLYLYWKFVEEPQWFRISIDVVEAAYTYNKGKQWEIAPRQVSMWQIS